MKAERQTFRIKKPKGYKSSPKDVNNNINGDDWGAFVIPLMIFLTYVGLIIAIITK